MKPETSLRKIEQSLLNFQECLSTDKAFRDAYYYILGQYFGDGCISKHARTYRLRIFAAIEYPQIIKEVEACLKILFPLNSIAYCNKPGCIEISVYSNTIPIMFPHCGIGKKHERMIVLSEIQYEFIREESPLLLKGLFHSDGCYYRQRTLNDGTEVMNYSFSNKSNDIHRIYQLALSYCGIEYSFHGKTKDDDSFMITGIYKRYEVDKAFSLIGRKS